MNNFCPYKIGVIDDWHCPQVGQDFIDGLRLAMDEVAAAGGLERNLELVATRVDGDDHVQVRQAAQALADNPEVIAVTGLQGAQAGGELGPVFDAAALPAIAVSGLRDWVGEYRYSVAPSMAADEGHVILHYLGGLERKAVALLSDNSGHAAEALDFCRDAAVMLKSRIALELILTNCAKADYPAVLTAAKAGGADALALFCSPRNIDAAIAGLGQARLPDEDIVAVAGGAWMHYQASPVERTRHANNWLGLERKDDENPRFRQFASHFADAYGRKAAHSHAAAGYDIGRVLCEAVEAARPGYRSGLQQALQELRFLPATLGTATANIGFFPHDRVGLKGNRPALVNAKGERLSSLR